MKILNRNELHKLSANQPELSVRSNRYFVVDAIEGVTPFKTKTDLRFFLLCRNIRIMQLKNIEVITYE